MRRLLALLLVSSFPPLAIAAEPKPAEPKVKLVVLVVFDQLRADFIDKWQPHFGDGGFKRLQTRGAWFTNCHYPYAITTTGPGHASMLTGYDTTAHGITTNVSTVRMAEGLTIYERLMDQFDPPDVSGLRNGYLFRTQHSADKKFVGTSICYWAKRSRALQTLTGHGTEDGDSPGALRYAASAFLRWETEAAQHGLGAPSFFMFLHFKNTDWTGHIAGDRSKQYRQVIIATDRRLYLLLEMLRQHGWDDTAVLVTTDHGFAGIQHARNGGRSVFIDDAAQPKHQQLVR